LLVVVRVVVPPMEEGVLAGGGKSSPITPRPFMASISYAPELLTPFMPRQSTDYLAELIARLQR